MQAVKGLPKKVVVIRTGGLGDFVLVIPLLVALIRMGSKVTVATRRQYFDIIGELSAKLLFLDVDEIVVPTDEKSLRSTFSESTVLSFWRDEDGSLRDRLRSFGALRMMELESRPNKPPHFTERSFQYVGIQWKKEYIDRSWLSAGPLSGNSLWVHPGSGSSSKNAPVAWYLKRIEGWLQEGKGDSVVVSFGEADAEVEKIFRLASGDMPLEFLTPRTCLELKDEMTKRAVLFVGNDSGPSHLAAALGIPTEVVYTVTDPVIWRPVGENVRILLARNLS